jgi:hypothetical protein
LKPPGRKLPSPERISRVNVAIENTFNLNQPKVSMKAQLAEFAYGRVILHVWCAWRDHKYRWHWQGVVRELAWHISP